MKFNQSCALPLLLSIAAAAASIQAAPWPQWLGPHRDGLCQETGLLQEWPDGGPPLVWKTTGLGGGYTTPSFAHGLIYGMGYVEGDEVVWALDEETGRTEWQTRTAAAFTDMGYNEGPRCTPTVDGDLVFTLGAGGNLACLDAHTGKLLWQQDLKKDFGGKMMSKWGYSESPLVDGDQVVCTPGGSKGSVAAFNKRTGKLIWQSADVTDDASYASLVIAEFGGIRQYVALSNASVYGVAAEDGALLWRAPRKGRTAVVPTPIISGNRVYVTSGYGVGCHCFEITHAAGKFSARQLYANKTMVNHHGGVVLVDGHLYGYSDGKGWVCQDLETGKMVWNEKEKLGKGAILYADGRLYLRYEGSRGTLALIECSPDGYVEKGRFDQPDRAKQRSWPHPVIHNGRLYVRDQGLLLAYDVKAK